MVNGESALYFSDRLPWCHLPIPCLLTNPSPRLPCIDPSPHASTSPNDLWRMHPCSLHCD